MSTLAEYEHLDASGHDISVSAEGVGNPFDGPVVVGLGNIVTDIDGYTVPDLAFTPDGARDFAASVLLAADAAERGEGL